MYDEIERIEFENDTLLGCDGRHFYASLYKWETKKKTAQEPIIEDDLDLFGFKED